MKNIMNIKKEVETFKDAAFFSLSEEKDKVIIRNKKTDALYEISYKETKDGFVFTTENAKQLCGNKKTQKDMFLENFNKFMGSLKGIFEDVKIERAISNLKGTLKNLPNISLTEEDEKKKKEDEENEDEDEKKKNEKANKKGAKSPVEMKTEYPMKAQQEEYKKAEQEFVQMLNFFNENNELIARKQASISSLRKRYNDVKAVYDEFNDHLKKLPILKKKLTKAYSEEIANAIFEAADFNKDVMALATSAIAKVKSAGLKMNAIADSKQIIAFFEELELGTRFGQMTQEPNRYDPRFLNFRMGIYSNENLKQLLEEFQKAFAEGYSNFNEEEMNKMNDMRMQLEYMFRTNIISDTKVNEIVEEFNKMFKGDKKDSLSNADEARGFKDHEEARANNVRGKIKWSVAQA